VTQRRPGRDSLARAVDRWRDRPVVVVGDVMLDEWRFTEPRRLSREAPAPVVTLRRREDAPGGAGNTAVNLAALGARPVLVGPLGDDEPGNRVRARLAAAGVTDRTVAVPGTRTATKRRVLAAGQILLCEEDAPAGEPVADAMLAALEAVVAAGGNPVLAVCDYGLGALDERVRRWLVAHRDEFAMVALDAHDLGRWEGLAPTVVTPSYAEAVPLLGPPPRPAGGDGDRAAVVTAYGARLLRRTGARIAAVTLDVAGAVVLTADDAYRTDARPAPPSHCVGAGDAYLAAMVLALAAGADVPGAAELAQLAAGTTVAGPGTCVCTRSALLDAVGRGPDEDLSVVDAATLAEIVRRHRERGARIVFTNGCFDVLHRGHVGYLSQARELGDVLIVAVNSDESVRRLKGPQRPVNLVEDRVAVLAALSAVDHVVVFEEDSPAALIEAVRPDVYVKGGDYPPEMVPEAPLVRRLHGEVRTLGYVPDRSTSAIIDRIRSRAPIPDATP
jgi:D-beta-D-heptose 7-phosphate kinase / D-beta-D-heptose 1-phosphate adenosyltransferase